MKMTAVVSLRLNDSVCDALDQLAGRLRRRQQAIREAVIAGDAVVAEIKRQIALEEANR